MSKQFQRLRPDMNAPTMVEMDNDQDRLHGEQIRVMRYGQCSGGCADHKVGMGVVFALSSCARKAYPTGYGIKRELRCSKTRLPCPRQTLGPIIELYKNINSGE